MHRFQELSTFFSVIDTFEECLKKEASVMSTASLESIQAFVNQKESLSTAYDHQLSSLQETGILKQLNKAEKDYVRIRLTHLRNHLEDNLHFLKSQENQAILRAQSTRKAIIKQQQSAFYSRRGQTSVVSKPLSLFERI